LEEGLVLRSFNGWDRFSRGSEVRGGTAWFSRSSVVGGGLVFLFSCKVKTGSQALQLMMV
jgi:hypothetical protein